MRLTEFSNNNTPIENAFLRLLIAKRKEGREHGENITLNLASINKIMANMGFALGTNNTEIRDSIAAMMDQNQKIGNHIKTIDDSKITIMSVTDKTPAPPKDKNPKEVEKAAKRAARKK